MTASSAFNDSYLKFYIKIKNKRCRLSSIQMILKQSSLMRFTAVGNNGGDYIVKMQIALLVYMNNPC
jgi:hypothetical protein